MFPQDYKKSLTYSELLWQNFTPEKNSCVRYWNVLLLYTVRGDIIARRYFTSA